MAVRSMRGKNPSPAVPRQAQHKHSSSFHEIWHRSGVIEREMRIEAASLSIGKRVVPPMLAGMPPIDLNRLRAVSCPFLSGEDSHPLGEESGESRHCP